MIKLFRTIIGGILVALGTLLLILPGPSIVLLVPGLMILSIDYPFAKRWLKKCQRLSRRSASWLDSKCSRRLYLR
uniref:PGPGW domain-containing protein n=1 Tax=Ningiella ruwaisensis TaxID=2364274 RepID=UPI00109F96FC|nr:PGPGW domain-containing protein [Ningiella ruwaisensis]